MEISVMLFLALNFSVGLFFAIGTYYLSYFHSTMIYIIINVCI